MKNLQPPIDGGRGLLFFAPIMLRHVALAMPGCTEAHVAVWAHKGLGARVQAHVHFEAALSREGRFAHVARVDFLHCKNDEI